MSSIMPLGAWVGAASKQTSTMPDVAGGWLRSLRSGGILGGDILYLGVSGLDTPIWDVLAPEGEQEEAPNRSRTDSISPGFPIRQAVPLGLARARFFCWARWARFFMGEKKDYRKYNTFVFIVPFFSSQGGRNGWMA
jgi:hypothetical protein